MEFVGRKADDSTCEFSFELPLKTLYHANPDNDVALVLCDGMFSDGSNDCLHWHFGAEQLADEAMFGSAIRPYDKICFSGFPEMHDIAGKRPILRVGHIASDPRYSYSHTGKSLGDCVAYEGFSFKGSSGSPIFAVPRGPQGDPISRPGYLIGVNAGRIKTPNIELTGISYFYKSSVIVEIAQQCGPL